MNNIDIIMAQSTDNIGELSFELLFDEEPQTLSSTKEEKDKKIEKKEKIEEKPIMFNRFKETKTIQPKYK